MPVDPMKIGDFNTPLVQRPGVKPQSSPVKEKLDAAEAKFDQEAASIEAEVEPLKNYEDKLKEAGLSRDEAARIVDAVLVRGFYEEDAQITKTIKARFRTRSARDTRRAQEHIEIVRPTFDSSYQDLLSRQLLAASLVQFGNEKLPHPEKRASQEDVEKAFQDRLQYVDALPDLTFRLLLMRLIKFDRKMSVLLEEGVIANF
jgi:hypothetical protein